MMNRFIKPGLKTLSNLMGQYPVKPNWLSIIKASDCLYSRRNRLQGRVIFGYSVRLRLFGKDIM